MVTNNYQPIINSNHKCVRSYFDIAWYINIDDEFINCKRYCTIELMI